MISEAIWAIEPGFLEFPLVITSQDENFFEGHDAFDLMRHSKTSICLQLSTAKFHPETFKRNTNLILGLNQDEGNFWNIYYVGEMVPYFNRSQPPPINESVFLQTLKTAWGNQPDVVRRAVKCVCSITVINEEEMHTDLSTCDRPTCTMRAVIIWRH